MTFAVLHGGRLISEDEHKRILARYHERVEREDQHRVVDLALQLHDEALAADEGLTREQVAAVIRLSLPFVLDRDLDAGLKAALDRIKTRSAGGVE
jgi:hypothetical protein